MNFVNDFEFSMFMVKCFFNLMSGSEPLVEHTVRNKHIVTADKRPCCFEI